MHVRASDPASLVVAATLFRGVPAAAARGLAPLAGPLLPRPLRRSGPRADILWDDGSLLLRRSHSLGREIMDRAKNKRDLEIPLPIVLDPRWSTALPDDIDARRLKTLRSVHRIRSSP